MVSVTVENRTLFDMTANDLRVPATQADRPEPVLADLLAQRWSPRSFDAEHVIADAELALLLEAGRWAPSSRNGQARRFVIGRRGGVLFGQISETLAANNATWAPQAALLLVGVLVRKDEAGRVESFAEYDLGQAIAHIGLQAEEMGLRMRQIGGFDRAALSGALGLGAPLEPFIVAAIGRQAHASLLHGELAVRETAPRTRLPIGDIVLARD
ncbi:nitroreductase [Arthrobacter ginsengisoli]|uniref:Nitroreductase n=1 Tax=Arthrobacter ginsengisoli TaxID=1356565 RepID=A0ABU1UDI8_9MICC|nr:nitroreductase family protein [Arthrobacter ginsengisoli]MDR7083254.1 nitroreductase [Arthrobacter ginsengisoli]